LLGSGIPLLGSVIPLLGSNFPLLGLAAHSSKGIIHWLGFSIPLLGSITPLLGFMLDSSKGMPKPSEKITLKPMFSMYLCYYVLNSSPFLLSTSM
jgi:hypothetical protein